MNYNDACLRMQEGELVRRSVWADEFIFIRPYSEVDPEMVSKITTLPSKAVVFLSSLRRHVGFSEYVCMWRKATRNGKLQGEVMNGWIPKTSDIQAQDWEVISVEVNFPTRCEISIIPFKEQE